MQKSGNKSEKIDITDESYLPPVSERALDITYGVFCGKNYTVGITTAGDALFAGSDTYIFNELKQLEGIKLFASGNDAAAAIDKHGKVVVMGKNADIYSEANEWQNIISLAFGKNFLVGLKSDGTVLACGNNDYGQCNVLDLKCVTQIDAAAEYCAFVLSNKTVATRGLLEGIENAEKFEDVEKVVCAESYLIMQHTNGEISTLGESEAAEWKNVTNLITYKDVAAAIDENGNLLCTEATFYEYEITDIESFSMGNGFISVMQKNGDVKSYGKNGSLQCNTESFKILPYVGENGYITGFNTPITAEEAKALLSASTGTDVYLYNGKNKLKNSSYAATGIVAKDQNENILGTILIYGDVNGDGIIDDADNEAINAHIEGNEQLSGVYLMAASTTHYKSGLTISPAGSYVKQYVYDPYNDSLREYYEQNNDVMGYIKVDGTKIDYPILYGDNFYYHTRTIHNHYSGVGSIYSAHNTYCKNNVVIGHNARASGRMFNGLHTIRAMGEKLLKIKNRVIAVTIYGEYSLWELYALYETGPYEPLSTQVNNINSLNDATEDEVENWIQGQLSRSEIDLKVNVTANDELLTLYTCSQQYYSDPNTQARLYLFFRRIR